MSNGQRHNRYDQNWVTGRIHELVTNKNILVAADMAYLHLQQNFHGFFNNTPIVDLDKNRKKILQQIQKNGKSGDFSVESSGLSFAEYFVSQGLRVVRLSILAAIETTSEEERIEYLRRVNEIIHILYPVGKTKETVSQSVENLWNGTVFSSHKQEALRDISKLFLLLSVLLNDSQKQQQLYDASWHIQNGLREQAFKAHVSAKDVPNDKNSLTRVELISIIENPNTRFADKWNSLLQLQEQHGEDESLFLWLVPIVFSSALRGLEIKALWKLISEFRVYRGWLRSRHILARMNELRRIQKEKSVDTSDNLTVIANFILENWKYIADVSTKNLLIEIFPNAGEIQQIGDTR